MTDHDKPMSMVERTKLDNLTWWERIFTFRCPDCGRLDLDMHAHYCLNPACDNYPSGPQKQTRKG